MLLLLSLFTGAVIVTVTAIVTVIVVATVLSSGQNIQKTQFPLANPTGALA